MNRYIILLLALFAMGTASCKKDGTATIAERPVVIGYLLAGHPISVKIYNQKEFTDTANYGALIGGLNLSISNGSKTVSLNETSNGTYTYSDSSFLKTGETYTLQFDYKNTAISATTIMPVATEGYKASRTVFARLQNATPTEEAETAVRMSWSNPDSLHHVLVFKNDQAYSYMSNGGNLPSNFTIDVKTVEAYDVPYSRFRYSGPYKVILYTINDEYAKILTSNTNTSSQQLNNPPGNIQNGYGIFTAMQADTVNITVNN